MLKLVTELHPFPTATCDKIFRHVGSFWKAIMHVWAERDLIVTCKPRHSMRSSARCWSWWNSLWHSARVLFQFIQRLRTITRIVGGIPSSAVKLYNFILHSIKAEKTSSTTWNWLFNSEILNLVRNISTLTFSLFYLPSATTPTWVNSSEQFDYSNTALNTTLNAEHT